MKARVRLDLPGKDGVALRKHLQQVEKQTGNRPAELVEPTIPPAAEYIWSWFWELDAARPAGMGVSPIGFHEIAAWRDLCGEIVRPWEVRAIKAMDAERMAATSAAMK